MHFRLIAQKRNFGIDKWRPSITGGVLKARPAPVTRTKIYIREKRGENEAMWKFQRRIESC